MKSLLTNSFSTADYSKLILSVLALFIFFPPAVYISLQLISAKNETGNQEAEYPLSLPPSGGRILIILLDSIRKDSLFSGDMPYVSALREKGAWGISRVVSTPLSIAGDHAIFSGVVSGPLSFLDDFSASEKPSRYDNLFRRVTEQKKRAVIFSSDCLRGAYGKDTDLSAFVPRCFLFSRYRDDARYIFDKSYEFLKHEKWDLAAVQFVTMDFLGHLETPRSPNYFPTLKLLDDYVRQLVELTTDADFVLITAEHGIDMNGFHVDRTEFVIETPFVLTGPAIKKSGPEDILQIDWAPTLSLLAGVSPFYPTPALPALDLLMLPPEHNSTVLRQFSLTITGNDNISILDELRKKRLAKMGRKNSPALSVLIGLATLCSLTLFAFVAVSANNYSTAINSITRCVAFLIFSLFILTCIELYFGVLNYISSHFPFSANHIFNNPVKVGLLLIFIVMIPMYYRKIIRKGITHADTVSLPLFITLTFSLAFIVTNPYHPLNWMVVCLPLFSWGVTRHPAWLIIFLAIVTGMAIRRLTFYHVYHPITLPDRWVFSLLVLFTGILFLLWKLRYDKNRIPIVGKGLTGILPCIVVIAFPFSAGAKTILLICGFIPLIYVGRRTQNTLDVWLAMWVTLFCLGTSGNINHLSHIVALPLFLAVWSLSEKSSETTKGCLVALVIFVLYLLPGNEFDLKILEMRDKYILGSVMAKQIEITVMVIGSRYIIPIMILVWMIKHITPCTSLASLFSITLFPIVFGIGICLVKWTASTFIDYPWNLFTKLTILFGFSCITGCVYFIVSVYANFIYPYYLKLRAK